MPCSRRIFGRLTEDIKYRFGALVGWPGGTSPPGSHRSVRKPLDLYGSGHPGLQDHWTEGTHFQCANIRGCLSVIPCQHSRAFFLPRSRLYFLRIQRIK